VLDSSGATFSTARQASSGDVRAAAHTDLVGWITRRGQEVGEGAPYDGIPVWLRVPLREWVEQRLAEPTLRGDLPAQVFQLFDATTHREEPLALAFRRTQNYFEVLNLLDAEDELDFIDFLVSLSNAWDPNVVHLNNLLYTGGSLWTVGERDDKPRLVRRVEEGVQQAAESVMISSGEAGRLLRGAWGALFGRDPDPEKAYNQAVKAVEAACTPVVLPRDSDRRLGKALGQMRTDGDWRLPFEREHEHAKSADVVLAMGRMLQAGQNDRHVSDGGSKSMSQASAEAAVMLAVPLVQWFASGAVARRP
jgi:hypothetical protein